MSRTKGILVAYGDFTLEQVGRAFGLTTQGADLFPGLQTAEVPEQLRVTLAKRTQLALISEKARSEFIVVPILLASRDLSPTPLAIFSGQRLDVDPARGLVRECDFILAAGPPVPPLRAPIVTIVEAKKNDIEVGLGECVAQMVAARLFNEAAGLMASPIYGDVTTGEVWQFLQLIDDSTLIDERRHYLDNVGTILAALGMMVASAVGSR